MIIFPETTQGGSYRCRPLIQRKCEVKNMTEFYEFAKQFDVIVIFILLYGFAIGSIVYWITDFLHWCWTKFKKHREKKRQAAKQPEE